MINKTFDCVLKRHRGKLLIRISEVCLRCRCLRSNSQTWSEELERMWEWEGLKDQERRRQWECETWRCEADKLLEILLHSTRGCLRTSAINCRRHHEDPQVQDEGRWGPQWRNRSFRHCPPLLRMQLPCDDRSLEAVAHPQEELCFTSSNTHSRRNFCNGVVRRCFASVIRKGCKDFYDLSTHVKKKILL